MAINSPQDFATAVLNDMGAPTSANNIKTMVDWIAAENAWPPPRNNPLNNGLGSGGGSGLGSYPSLEVAAQYAAQNLSSGDYGYPAVKAALMADAPEAQFKQAIINSSWAGGHYQGTDYGAGFSVGGAAPASNMTAADWQALSAAGAAGGTQYLEAAAAGSQSTTGSSSSTAAPTSNAPAQSVTIGGQTYTTPAGDANASTQISALGQMAATLAGYGFSGSDLQSLTSWAWTEMTGNVDPSQIAIDIQTPGSPVYPIFEKQFPGFTAANQQLTSQGLQAVSVSQYQQTQTSYEAIAQAAGLPPGFINSQDIGTLIGGNVSTAEFNARVNNAVALAYNSTPEQQAMFNQYFGTQYDASNPYLTQGGVSGSGDLLAGAAPSGHGPLTAGQIAAIALDPTKAEPLIAQQITAAQIGGASVTSGVGGLNVDTATKLAQAGITEAQATNAFQNLAPYASLETARPGMGGEAQQGVVSADQLATGNLIGDTGAQRQQQTAVEVAKAPFSGGGGYVGTSKGSGVGSANPNGTGNT